MNTMQLTLFSTYIKNQITQCQFKKALVVLVCTIMVNAYAQEEPIAPPSIGQSTKGAPASDEHTISETKKESVAASTEKENTNDKNTLNKILTGNQAKEYRRESGQVYRIELDNAFGGKQILEETDSDGRLESTSDDLEKVHNLPKWKVGSW